MKERTNHPMLNARQNGRVTPESYETPFHLLETLPGALFFIDGTEAIVYANASAQAMTGALLEALRGRSLWRAAPQLASTALYQAMRTTRRTREPTEVEYMSPMTHNWLHVQLSPTVRGLLLQFHEKKEPLRIQEEPVLDHHLVADVLDTMYVGVGFLTPEGVLLEINESPLADAQIRREEVIGQPFADTPWWSFYPASQQQLRTAIQRAGKGETVRFETLVHPREGMDLHLEATITPHRSMDRHIEYLIYVGADITARKQAEAEIHALVDALPQWVWISRPDGSVIHYNQRAIAYLAMTHEQAEGAGLLAGVHPDDRPRVWEAWQTALQTGEPYEVEQRMQDGSSGVYRWFLVRGVPQRNTQGTILHWVGTCTDVEEQKQAEQRLKASEQNWRVLAEAVPQLVWSTQPDGRLDYCNQRYCDQMQANFEQLRDYGWRQFLHPEDAERVLTLRRHSLATGEPYEIACRLKVDHAGTYRWFLARGMPVRDEAGQVLRWFGTNTDIEEQKKVEQKLKESEQNWRTLAEMVPQLVWIERADGYVEYVNQRYTDYLHARPEQLQSFGWSHFLHPDDARRTQASWCHVCASGEPYEIEYRLKEGQTGMYRWFLARAMPVHDEAGQIVKWFGTCTDIEEQKRIEDALRQSQERATALMDSNIIGITVFEGEQIVDANDAFLRMTGYTREDLYAMRLNWIRMTPPEYLDRARQAQQELDTQQSLTPYEKEYVCQDGSHLPVVVGAVVLQHRPRQAIAFVLDNSARKELEQRKDDFISMASHELRTPLTALKLQTQLVRKRLEKHDQHEAASELSRVEGPIKQLERLIGELLDVSRIQAGRLEYVWETVDLDALLREITDTMQHAYPSHRILVRGAVRTNLIGDRDRLGQVFTNLLSNAIKYSPGAKTVEMELSSSEEVVTTRVRDHGLGIPREQRDKIFERFYRVADPKQRAIAGLGIGLYIVAEIVKRHGGSIIVDSEVGTGSTFQVTLPRRGEI